jgi:hypothetical protein
MKNFYILPLIASLAFFVSCQKQSEERPVLTAEEKQRLEVREKEALAEKAAANAPAEKPAASAAASPAPN